METTMMSQSMAYVFNHRDIKIDTRQSQYPVNAALPATPVYSRPGSSCSQPPTLYSNGPAMLTPVGSPPMSHKAPLLLDTDVYDIHQFPSTPPLSTSSSTVGSPKSFDVMQTPMNPMFSGLDGLPLTKGVFDSVESSVLDWSSSDSSNMADLYLNTMAMNGDILSVTSCPSLSPSPVPYARSLSADQGVDFCDPRNLTVSSTPNPALTGESTMAGLVDEELKGEHMHSQFDFNPAVSGLPTFEELSDLDSEDDFSNLVNLGEISTDMTRPRACTGSSIVSLGHGSFIGDDEFSFDDSEAFSFPVMPSPPSSIDCEDDCHKNKKQKKSHKKDTRFAKPTMNMASTGDQATPATCETAHCTESESESADSVCDDGSTPAPAPTSRRGRKQSLTEDPSKTFVCDLCNRRFRRQEHLKRHYRSLHTQDKPFECTDCGKKFSRSDNLAQHARTHTSGAFVMNVLEEGETHNFDASMMGPGGDDYNTYGKVLFQIASEVPGSASDFSSEESDQGRKKRKRTD